MTPATPILECPSCAHRSQTGKLVEASPDIVGRDAAAHADLIRATEKQRLFMHCAACPAGSVVEGHVTGPVEPVVPMPAELARDGHSYDAGIDTEDERTMGRIHHAAAGGIAYLGHDHFTNPPVG